MGQGQIAPSHCFAFTYNSLHAAKCTHGDETIKKGVVPESLALKYRHIFKNGQQKKFSAKRPSKNGQKSQRPTKQSWGQPTWNTAKFLKFGHKTANLATLPATEGALTKHESAAAAVQKKNALSVEALITSHAVVLLGMLSVINAEKLDTSLRFVARSLLARRARISWVHFCLSITLLPWSEPRLACNPLLLTLKSRNCHLVLCWTLGHWRVTLTLKLQKNLA